MKIIKSWNIAGAAPACWMTAACLAAAAFAQASPALASGPYVVDDAAITPAGEGQLEAWASFARGRSLVVAVPAVTFEALPGVEWSLPIDTSRAEAVRQWGVGLEAKLMLTPEAEEPGRLGLAVSGGVRVDLDDGSVGNAFVNTIATFMPSEQLLLHANGGWQRDIAAGESALSWGVRGEAFAIPDRLSLHAELFGTTQTSAGFQLGVRPTLPGGRFDLELAYGRNIDGAGGNWATLGFAARF